MRKIVLLSLATASILSGCGNRDTAPGTVPATAPAITVTDNSPTELGVIREVGFGQRQQYVWVSAVVHNNSTYVGQTVTVNFNLLDGQGQILESVSQIEAFSQPGADHILGTQVNVDPGKVVAKVEAALDIVAAGTFSDQAFPLLPVTPAKVTEAAGSTTASFELSNPLTSPIKSPRIALACRDASGKIVGGGSTYPVLVPAGGRIKVDADIIVSTTPRNCSIFVGSPTDWAGAEREPSTPVPAQVSGTATAAFKSWVQQFGKRDWRAQYSNLVTTQKDTISEAEYIACRSGEATPKLKWVKVLSVQNVGKTKIPGSKVSLSATKVTAQVSMNGIKIPVDAHMILESTDWRWMMTKQNIENCMA